MKNGTYTIINSKNGSKLVITLDNAYEDAGVNQYDKTGKLTANQIRSYKDCINAISKAQQAGMEVTYV